VDAFIMILAQFLRISPISSDLEPFGGPDVDAYSAHLLTGSQSVTDFRRRGAKKRGSPSFFRR
jgi:hypothetical protein